MARKSRKVLIVNGLAEQAPTPVEKVYATAIYARLSIEDNGIKGSSSIEDQIEIAQRYIEDRPYLQLAGTYCDNGSSGTNFDRDGFQTLIGDIKCGKIQCLIVKDLSRFARNHLEAGNYLVKIFPFLGVRFISVTDNIDTFDPRFNEQGMIVAIKTLVHDFYSKDLSNKIKSSMRTKMLNGDFIGDYAPYGFIKSPDNKNRLLIDDEAAQNVRNIFKWRLEGHSCPKIAQLLNDMDVLTPNNYKYSKGIVATKRYGKRVLWYSELVKSVLDNATYAGYTINGRTKTLPNLGYMVEKQPENDWIVVQGTHEAIVSEEDYKEVQRLLNEIRTKRKNYKSNEKRIEWAKQENIFKGILYCAECGRKLKRHAYFNASKETIYNSFFCRYCKNTLPKNERPKCLTQMKIEVIVSNTISKYIEMFTDDQSLKARAKAINETTSKQDATVSELTGCKRKLSKINNRLTTLYTHYQDGVLTEDDYLHLKSRYDNDKSSCSDRICELEALQSQYKQEAISEKRWLDAIERVKSHPLNTDLVNILIERIEITHDHRLLITYKFRNPLSDIVQDEGGKK